MGSISETHMKVKNQSWRLSIFLQFVLSAVSSAQNVIAWGDNSYGATDVPPGLTNAVAISSHGGHSFALKADGTLATWGTDVGIELSQMTASADVPAWAPPGVTNVVAVATGLTHSLALLRDGTVAVWSHFSSGEVIVRTMWGTTTNLSHWTGVFALTNVPPLSNVTAVAAGEFHSLALRSDGTVVAWGTDDFGDTDVPPALTNIVAVSAGGFHSLALRADRTVAAWGWNDFGQANVPPGLTNVIDVAAGLTYSLALCANGTVVAWGDDSVYSSGATDVPISLTNAVAIASSDHSLALRVDDTVVSWGNVQLPDGSALIIPAGLTNVVSVAAGTYHDVALISAGAPAGTPLADRTIFVGGTVYFREAITGAQPLSYQWGFNGTNLPGATTSVLVLTNVQLGQAGEYSVTVSNTSGATVIQPGRLFVVPFFIAGPDPTNQVVYVGGSAAFAADIRAGTPVMYQWRQNGTNVPGGTDRQLILTNIHPDQAGAYTLTVSNALGMAETPPAFLTVLPFFLIGIPPSNLVTYLGGSTTMAVVVEAATPLTYQWRVNGHDLNNATNSVLTLSNVRLDQAGTYSVLVSNSWGAITSPPTVLNVDLVAAWGENDGVWAASGQPAGLTNDIAVAAGFAFSLVLQRDGTVVAWGDDNLREVDVPNGLTNVVAVTAGWHHSLALRSDGTVAGWGDNSYGATDVPAGLSNVVAIAAAGYPTSFALRADGSVVAWGQMNENNSWVPAHVPPGLSNVVALAAGGLHVMALRSDGTVVAWGDNSYGQTNVPVGLTNVIAIAAGTEHSLAVRAGGTVVAWGGNGDGQTDVPIDLSNVVAVAAGEGDSFALKGDGAIIAWGRTYDGSAWVPTPVPADLANVVAIAACDSYGLALIGSGPPAGQVTLSNPTHRTNSFSVQVASQSGRVYALEYKDALTDSTWSALPLVTGSGGLLTIRDPTAAGLQRFYRVRRW